MTTNAENQNQTQDVDGTTTTQETPTTEQAAEVDTSKTEDTPAPSTTSLPEGLPDAFLKDGALDVETLKAIAEEKAQAAERAKDIPEDGKYKITLPEDLKDAVGQPLQVDENSLALAVLMEVAPELKLTHGEVSSIVAKAIAKEFAATQEIQKAIDADLKTLGEKPEVRIKAVMDQVKARLGDKANDLLNEVPTSSKAIIALEELMAQISSTSPNHIPLNTIAEKSVADRWFPSMKQKS